jgi:hypothetical protein
MLEKTNLLFVLCEAGKQPKVEQLYIHESVEVSKGENADVKNVSFRERR